MASLLASHRDTVADLELQPGVAVAEQRLGVLLLRKGDADSAIACLSRAAALDPGNSRSLELLQQAREQRLWSRGERALQRAAWDEAAKAYRELIELCGEHRQALARLDLLASLGPSELPALVETATSNSSTARLAAFQRSLDQAESQLKMLGVLG